MVNGQPNDGNQRPTAFIIMPFNENLDWMWEQVYRTSFEEEGFKAVRADTTLDQSNILREVIHGIESASIVVADLTALNPNVMYELGVAHTFGRSVVMTTQDIKSLPFDLRSYRVTEYSTDFPSISKLSKQLREIAAAHRRGEVAFGNPVTDFSEVNQTNKLTSAVPKSNTVGMATNTDGTKGIIDFEQDLVEHLPVVQRSLEDIGEFTHELTDTLRRQTEKIKDPNLSQTDLLRERNRVSEVVAAKMNHWAIEVSERATTASNSLQIVEAGIDGLSQLATNPTQEERIKLRSVLEGVENSLPSIRSVIPVLLNFRQQIEPLSGVSRSMSRATANVKASTDQVIQMVESTLAFGSRISAVIQDRIQQDDEEDDELGTSPVLPS